MQSCLEWVAVAGSRTIQNQRGWCPGPGLMPAPRWCMLAPPGPGPTHGCIRCRRLCSRRHTPPPTAGPRPRRSRGGLQGSPGGGQVSAGQRNSAVTRDSVPGSWGQRLWVGTGRWGLLSQGQNSALGGEAGPRGAPSGAWTQSGGCRRGPWAQRALRGWVRGGSTLHGKPWARPPLPSEVRPSAERHLGYLDGEPAKAVLEVQGPLVSAEGDGVLGVQPLQFLLVVDHKDLPENTLVRVPENTSPRSRA